MGAVFIDGERVEFEGAAPATCGEACALIEGHLSSQGCLIESVRVDGELFSLEAAQGVEVYEKVEFVSVTPQKQLLAMCGTWAQECAGRVADAGSVASFVLRNGRDGSRSRVVGLLEALRPLIEGLGILQNYGGETQASWAGGFSKAFEAGIASIDGVVDAVESGNCVRLSDRLALELSVSWAEIERELTGKVIPQLEEEAAG